MYPFPKKSSGMFSSEVIMAVQCTHFSVAGLTQRLQRDNAIPTVCHLGFCIKILVVSQSRGKTNI